MCWRCQGSEVNKYVASRSWQAERHLQLHNVWNLKYTVYSGRVPHIAATSENIFWSDNVCFCFDLLNIWQEHCEHMDSSCLVALGCWWSKAEEDIFLAHIGPRVECCINKTVWQLLLTVSVPLWLQSSRTVNRSTKTRILTSWFTVQCAEITTIVSRSQHIRTSGMWVNRIQAPLTRMQDVSDVFFFFLVYCFWQSLVLLESSGLFMLHLWRWR